MFLHLLYTGFPIVGEGGAPHPTFFSNPPPPSKPMPPMGHPSFKNEGPPSEKTIPLPLKREAPFHEMIPRKGTINNNLKSS